MSFSSAKRFTSPFPSRVLTLALFIAIILAFTFSISPFQPRAAAQEPRQAKWSTTSGSNLSTNGFTFRHGTYTKLDNGTVIATGGGSVINDEYLRSVEIYSPLIGKWDTAEPMNFPRFRHDALLLPNGKLLVIGGFRPNASPPYVYAGPPEVYDPATGHWTVLPITGEDLAPYYTLIPFYPLPVLLPDKKVLLFFGINRIRPLLLNLSNNAVSFGPFSTNFDKGLARPSSNAVVLRNGKVMLLVQHKVLLYDPFSLAWSETSVPSYNGVELGGSITTLLPNSNPFALLSTYVTPEQQTPTYFTGVFDTSTQSWQKVTPRNQGEGESYSVVLPQGDTVLTVEGNYAFLYDINTGASKPAVSPQDGLGIPTLLADGRVLSGERIYGIDFGGGVAPTLVNTSAANYRAESLASGSIVSVFGAGIGGSSIFITYPGPTGDPTFPNITLTVGKVFANTPDQINYLLPDNLPNGQVEMTIGNQKGLFSITKVAPGIFTANADGRGVPAATVLRANFNGTQVYEPVAQYDAATGRFVPVEIPVMGPAGDAYLVLFGTGWRHRSSLSNVTVYIGGVYATTQYIGAQSDFDGLDQMNILIPRSLAGRGEVEVLVTVDGKTANPVKIKIK